MKELLSNVGSGGGAPAASAPAAAGGESAAAAAPKEEEKKVEEKEESDDDMVCFNTVPTLKSYLVNFAAASLCRASVSSIRLIVFLHRFPVALCCLCSVTSQNISKGTLDCGHSWVESEASINRQFVFQIFRVSTRSFDTGPHIAKAMSCSLFPARWVYSSCY